MQSIEYEVSDVDFLIERFAALTEKQVYELPYGTCLPILHPFPDGSVGNASRILKRLSIVLRLIIPCKKLCL